MQAHKLITGTTGSGKSRFIASLAVQLLNCGIAVGVIDPHGDLVRSILAILLATGFYENSKAYERVWYIDFGREDAFLPFNVLSQPFPVHTVAANVVEAFKRAWPSLADGSAASFENMLLAASVVLIENKLPLTALRRLLSDPDFREPLVQRTTDALIKDFFQYQFASYGKRAGMLSESTLRRVFLLSFSPALRFSLGQRENRLNLRTLMDNNISCLFNLSNLDAQTQRLLGSLLTVSYETASLSRADMPEEKRKPYHLFIDEFGQFCSQSEEALERMLVLTRKYGLSVTLASQVVAQIKHLYPALQNALHMTLRMGDVDAPFLAPKFTSTELAQIHLAGADRFLSPQATSTTSISDAQARLAWGKLVQELEPREALIKLGHETVRMKTIGVPDHPELEKQLALVERVYAGKLLTPHSEITDVAGDGNAGVSDLSPNREASPRLGNAPAPVKREKDSDNVSPGTPPTGTRRSRRVVVDDE